MNEPHDPVILLSDRLEGPAFNAANRVLIRYGRQLYIRLGMPQPIVRDAVNLLGRIPGLSLGNFMESLTALHGALYDARMRFAQPGTEKDGEES